MSLDEQLRRELDRAGRPADPTSVYERLIRQKERRRVIRQLRVGGLTLIVIAGSSLGFLALSRVFGTQQQPAAGPSNGRIVFTNMEPGLAIPGVTAAWYLSAIDPDGTDLSFIGPLAVDDAEFPSFSPDGARIAFVGFTIPDRGNPIGSIYVSNADGSDVREIFRPEDGEQVEAIVWSPDGARIGYELAQGYESGDETALTWTVWTMTPDGGDRRQVTSTGREMHFSWSPDGARIVFERWSPIRERSDLGTAGSDLFVVDADGSNEVQLTSDGTSRDPAWSPDGTQIAFVHRPRGGQHVAVMNVDGSGLRELVSLSEWGAVGIPYGNTVMWSPDGTLIAFTSRTEEDDCRISTVNPIDGSVRTIVSMPASESCPGQYGMSWAPAIESSTPSASPTVDGSPSAEPTPSASPDSRGVDIGVGFPVCDVTSVSGEFAPGVTGTAYVATKMSDLGRCPNAGLGGAFQVVAVDVTGDGTADTSFGPVECDPFCTAFAAPDVDLDGIDELLIENIQFTIAGLRMYEVRSEPPEVFPVTVSTPGYPEGDLPPGAEPQLWLGGDGFNADTLRCATSPLGRVLIQTSAIAVPGDSPDSVWQAAETVFALNPDGTVAVVSSRTFEEPVEPGPPSFDVPGDGICGARIVSPTFASG